MMDILSRAARDKGLVCRELAKKLSPSSLKGVVEEGSSARRMGKLGSESNRGSRGSESKLGVGPCAMPEYCMRNCFLTDSKSRNTLWGSGRTVGQSAVSAVAVDVKLH